ncbi:MAG: DUF805 domain-containing protein [Puniceicoccales bacterium]|nr:DUF805 domain-containing protein [Puniceicoccales bacterium]
MKVRRLLSPRGRIGRLCYLGLSFLLILLVVIFILGFVALGTRGAVRSRVFGSPLYICSLILFVIFCLYLGFILELKRLHDINMSGWCCLWLVFSGICERMLEDGFVKTCSLPVVWKYVVTVLLNGGVLVGLVLNIMLFFRPGTKGPNRFGERASTLRELFRKPV